MIFILVLLGLIHFSDMVMLRSGPNSSCQQNLKPQVGLRPQCPICADMLLSIACQGTQESIAYMYKRSVTCLTHQAYYARCPGVINKLIEKHTTNRDLRDNMKIEVSRCKTNFGSDIAKYWITYLSV